MWNPFRVRGRDDRPPRVRPLRGRPWAMMCNPFRGTCNAPMVHLKEDWDLPVVNLALQPKPTALPSIISVADVRVQITSRISSRSSST